jgi:hypothetical protein
MAKITNYQNPSLEEEQAKKVEPSVVNNIKHDPYAIQPVSNTNQTNLQAPAANTSRSGTTGSMGSKWDLPAATGSWGSGSGNTGTMNDPFHTKPPSSHVGPRPDEAGNAGGLDNGYRPPAGVPVNPWGNDRGGTITPPGDPLPIQTGGGGGGGGGYGGGPMGSSSYMDPQFEAWLRDMLGGPRDTSSEQAYLEQIMQQQMGAGIADMRAQGSMGGLGMVGATGALEGDLRRQGALDQAGAVFGLQQGARDEALARGQVGAGFFGDEAGRTFEQLESDKDRAREDAMLDMLSKYLLGEDTESGPGGPSTPGSNGFGKDEHGNTTLPAIQEDAAGVITNGAQAAAVGAGVPQDHTMKNGGPSPGATDIQQAGPFVYWTEPDGTKWWYQPEADTTKSKGPAGNYANIRDWIFGN